MILTRLAGRAATGLSSRLRVLSLSEITNPLTAKMKKKNDLALGVDYLHAFPWVCGSYMIPAIWTVLERYVYHVLLDWLRRLCGRLSIPSYLFTNSWRCGFTKFDR
jgi:hypothetical protein